MVYNQRSSKNAKTNDYDSSSDFVEGCNNNMSSDDNSDDNKEGNSNKIPLTTVPMKTPIINVKM